MSLDTQFYPLAYDISERNEPNLWIKCPRCLVSSMDGSGHSKSCRLQGTESGVRSNIYALKLLEMFMIRVKNQEDLLYILNKNTNAFEIVNDNLTISANSVDGIFSIGKSTDGRMSEYNLQIEVV